MYFYHRKEKPIKKKKNKTQRGYTDMYVQPISADPADVWRGQGFMDAEDVFMNKA